MSLYLHTKNVLFDVENTICQLDFTYLWTAVWIPNHDKNS